MSTPNVTATVRQAGEGVSIIDIHGEVTAQAEGKLMEAYNQASAAGARALVLNFAGLEYMNSSGIGLLVTLLIRANRHSPRQQLLAVGLSEHYRHIFELTRLNEAIRIFETERDALAVA